MISLFLINRSKSHRQYLYIVLNDFFFLGGVRGTEGEREVKQTPCPMQNQRQG